MSKTVKIVICKGDSPKLFSTTVLLGEICPFGPFQLKEPNNPSFYYLKKTQNWVAQGVTGRHTN